MSMFSRFRKSGRDQEVEREADVESPASPPVPPGCIPATSPAAATPTEDSPSEAKRGQFSSLLKQGWTRGLELSKDEAVKGRIYLEKSLGLGAKPNVIPADDAVITGQMRTVEIGWHPVVGFAGKWFAEQTRLGKKIAKEVGKYPDPTQHWAVLVGDYCHQLWMDEKLDVIYINEQINREMWHTFEVGKTRFNDEALRQASEMTIHNMRSTRPAYNLISNNCQNFAVNLLDAIQLGSHRDFATAFSVYSRATGKGAIKDLFAEPPPEEQVAPGETQGQHQATMQYAQQVMQENTTQLDDHPYHHHHPHA